MPIRTEDVKIRASQRMTDYPDGGGFMTAHEIVDGQINNVFLNISRVDRTVGNVSIMKCFMHVDTEDTEPYMGANVIISELVRDPHVRVALFTTENPGDVRADAVNRLESYTTLGPRAQFWLWGDQPAGSRSLLMFGPVSAELPKTGEVLCLFNNKGTLSEQYQYVRISKVTAKDQSFIIGGQTVTRKVLTVEISDPLEFTVYGIEMMTNDAAPTSVYTTIFSAAAKYYGVMHPTAPIAKGDTTIQVDSIYTQLVPTNQVETPLLGLTPGDVGPIKQSGSTCAVNFPSFTGSVLNIGQAFVPGTLALTIGGVQLSDNGNRILMQGSNQAGTIEYSLGKITLSGSRSGAVSATFDPGVAMSIVPHTLMIPVLPSSRGYNYVAILWPPPAPGTISVDYMAEGKWYRLRDDGQGLLTPDIENTGTGRVLYDINQLALTTAALPDVDTPILIRWGAAVEVIRLQGAVDIEVDPVQHTLTGDGPVDPGSLTITWPVGIDQTATATDDGTGRITGDAAGWINYGSREMEFTPTKLPVSGGEYTINHRKYPHKTHAASGATFALPDAPIKPGTLALDVALSIGGWTHTYKLRDNGSGAMSAPGFSATLSQARASLNDSSQYNTSVDQEGHGMGGGPRLNDNSNTDSDILIGSKESTVNIVAGGLSATIDYVSGQVVFDLTTATARKSTISARAQSRTATATTIKVDGWGY